MTPFLTFAFLASALMDADAEKVTARQHLEKLQGRWVIVSVTHEGKAVPQKKPVYWTVKGDRVVYTKTAWDEISLFPNHDPHLFEFEVVRDGEVKKRLQGIYSLDKDELKFCIDVGEKSRPTTFESKPMSGHRLIVLKRAKEKPMGDK